MFDHSIIDLDGDSIRTAYQSGSLPGSEIDDFRRKMIDAPSGFQWLIRDHGRDMQAVVTWTGFTLGLNEVERTPKKPKRIEDVRLAVLEVAQGGGMIDANLLLCGQNEKADGLALQWFYDSLPKRFGCSRNQQRGLKAALNASLGTNRLSLITVTNVPVANRDAAATSLSQALAAVYYRLVRSET